MAACVGTRDDEELKELFDNVETFDLSFFSNNTVVEFVKHFISTGTLHDARVNKGQDVGFKCPAQLHSRSCDAESPRQSGSCELPGRSL